MRELDSYEQKLLEGWEDIVKKGQLTFWIMLALKVGPKHMAQIKQFINEFTGGLRMADDKSLYRALRRFDKAELIDFRAKASPNGPDLKVYRLTPVGQRVLAAYIERNIVGLFFNSRFKEILSKEK